MNFHKFRAQAEQISINFFLEIEISGNPEPILHGVYPAPNLFWCGVQNGTGRALGNSVE